MKAQERLDQLYAEEQGLTRDLRGRLGFYFSAGMDFQASLQQSQKYHIDYICGKPVDEEDAYYQLVRSADKAILYANPLLDNVFLQCWRLGIKIEDVVVL